jgi:redox-sensitive bicupin YhaK (pirin superfamily)
MKAELHAHDTRGVAEHDWLSSRFSFSFADYYNPNRMNFGALRVLNDDKIAAGNGFGMHPHRDMEIISIPLYGELAHKDSLGNEVTIGPEDVQTMSAGSGVVHSEMNPSHDVDGHFLQIWIQTRQNGIPPAHGHGVFPSKEQLNNFVTLVRPDTMPGPGLPIHQDAYITRGRFMRGQVVQYELKSPTNGVFIFLISGTVTIGDQVLVERDALAITEASTIDMIPSGEEAADILIIEVPMS